MSSPFEFEATRSNHRSDDGFSDDSNFENLSSERTAHTTDQQNLYWLAKQVLASRFAQTVVRRSAASSTPDGLKVSQSNHKTTVLERH